MQNNAFDLEPVLRQVAAFGEKELALEVLKSFETNTQTLSQNEMLAKCFMVLGEPMKAMKYGDKALELITDEEQRSVMLKNMISIYRNAAYPEKALGIIEVFEKYVHNDELLIEKAEILYELNRKIESEKILSEINASTLKDHIKVRFDALMGNLNLWNGQFRRGLQQVIFDGNKARELTASVKEIFHTRRELPFPFWEGTPDCKNLVIYAEAGVGDEILNIRFMNQLKEKGINPVWYGVWHANPEVNKRGGLFDLFTQSGFRVIRNTNELDSNLPWMWTYSQYLPIHLGLNENDLWNGPYLKANKKNLKGKKKKVGIRWYGNLTPMHRNYPLKQLCKVLKDTNAEFYSLQRDTGLDEIDDFPNLIDLQHDLADFVTTAEYINSMDFVITSCTSIAHLSAALGKKTYVFVPVCAYYPWCHSTAKSPWYGDHVTLLRQVTPRCWDEPMAELANLLAKEKA